MRITKGQLRQIIRETVQQRPAHRRSRALREAAMARPELNRILKQHQLWAVTSGREGVQADLRGANLQSANLRDVNLRKANLQDADLRGADLRRTDLLLADLRGADLRGADLRVTYLQYADLRGAQFDVNISHCWSFCNAKFTSDALPWLSLHPKWSDWKDSVRCEVTVE